MLADDKDPDPDENDLDTVLILDYLAGKLDPEEVAQLEERARQDKAFRYKLADIVLLKGLVMLALEKNPGPTARDCRRTRRMFLEYLKGGTSARKTAQLSRHVEDCFECELAFERFQEKPSGVPDTSRGRWGGLWRRRVTQGRNLAVAAGVLVVLAAGGFGLVKVLTSSAGPILPGSAFTPRSPAQPDDLILRRDEILGALAEVAATDPALDADGRLSELVHEIVDPTTTADERYDLYRQLGREFGRKAEPLLWVLAANEPIERARAAVYRAIDIQKTNAMSALLAATRREIDMHSKQALPLLPALFTHPSDDAKNYIRRLFASEEKRDDEWWVQVFRVAYGPMKGDPVIERRMTSYLIHQNDHVRSLAALASSDAGNASIVPIALELFNSADARARFNGVLIVKRHGTQEDFTKVLVRDWSLEPELRVALENAMRTKGFVPPKHP